MLDTEAAGEAKEQARIGLHHPREAPLRTSSRHHAKLLLRSAGSLPCSHGPAASPDLLWKKLQAYCVDHHPPQAVILTDRKLFCWKCLIDGSASTRTPSKSWPFSLKAIRSVSRAGSCGQYGQMAMAPPAFQPGAGKSLRLQCQLEKTAAAPSSGPKQ